jgi:hypothetical protein
MTYTQESNVRRIIVGLLILLVAVLGATAYVALCADAETLNKKRIREYRRIIVANSSKGADAIAILESSFPGFADWRRGNLLEELGRTKDPYLIKFLLDTAVRHRSGVIAARSGGALRHYDSIDQTKRKEICHRLIRKLASLSDAAGSRAPSHQQAISRARAHLRAVSKPWMETLRALTGQRLQHPDDWREFWNRNHKRDWDTSRGRGVSRGGRLRTCDDGSAGEQCEEDRVHGSEKAEIVLAAYAYYL